MAILKRGSTYHFKMRVPVRYAKIERRSFVFMSLRTDSEQVAALKAPLVKAELIEAWEAELRGSQAIARERFEAAKEMAARRGFAWMKAEKVAEEPLADILNRIDASEGPSGNLDSFRAEAMLGGAKEPVLNVSTALEMFWELAADKTRGMSNDQIRRWENPRKKAVNNFISVCGDLEVVSISADSMLDFRQW